MKIRILGIAVATSLLMMGCAEKTQNVAEEMVTEDVVEEVVEDVDPMDDKGVGVVTEITLADVDQTMVDAGKVLYEAKCTACHKIEKRHIGPGLAGITERRTPEWIMNMILDPETMVKENKLAKELLMEYISPMANQSLTEDEARSILEYFRTI